MRTLILEGSRPLGAPADWDQQLDGECGTLHVIDHVDTLSGQNVMYSFYKPTPDDLQALSRCGILRLGIHGRCHPVIQLGILGPKLAAEIEAAEGFDMGPVIERE
jgi:hypothetical protein